MTTDEVKTKKPPLLKTRFCRGTDLSEIEDSYEFPRAREGEVAERNCPLGWAGVARWRCGEGGEWASKYPDFSVGKVDGLNSQIIGASVNFGKRRIARMAQDLANSGYNAETSVDGPRIKFRNLRTVDVNDGNGSVMCSYWHIGRDEWATDGCRMVLLTPSEVHCVCNHLTNFAVLMDIHGAVIS
ncbi:unnamed protein product, partial [Notodromas monacha]